MQNSKVVTAEVRLVKFGSQDPNPTLRAVVVALMLHWLVTMCPEGPRADQKDDDTNKPNDPTAGLCGDPTSATPWKARRWWVTAKDRDYLDSLLVDEDQQ